MITNPLTYVKVKLSDLQPLFILVHHGKIFNIFNIGGEFPCLFPFR